VGTPLIFELKKTVQGARRKAERGLRLEDRKLEGGLQGGKSLEARKLGRFKEFKLST